MRNSHHLILLTSLFFSGISSYAVEGQRSGTDEYNKLNDLFYKEWANGIFETNEREKATCIDSGRVLVEVSKSLGHQYNLVKSSRLLSYAYDKLEMFDSAIYFAFEGIRWIGDDIEEYGVDYVALHRNLGNLCGRLNRSDIGVKYLETAMNTARDLGLENEYRQIIRNVCSRLSNQGRYREGGNLLMSVFDDIHKMGNLDVCRTYNRLGLTMTYYAPDSAIIFFERLYEWAKNKEDVHSYMERAMHNIGNVYLQEGIHLDSAIKYFKISYELKKSGNVSGIEDSYRSLFISLMDLGNTYFSIGEKDSAFQYWNRALEHIPAARPSVENYPKVLKSLASLYRERNDFKRSVELQDQYAKELELRKNWLEQVESSTSGYDLEKIIEDYELAQERESSVFGLFFSDRNTTDIWTYVMVVGMLLAIALVLKPIIKSKYY